MRFNQRGVAPIAIVGIILIALAVAVVGAGVAYYFWYDAGADQTTTNTNSNLNTNANTNSNTNSTINICERSLSGSPSLTVQTECEVAGGVIRCGNGWCVCACQDELNQNTNANTNTDDGTDTDSDGLTDVEEAIYGTDINDPDTDADGYTDGEEVAGGYNPLGEGKLTVYETYTNSEYGFSLDYPSTWTKTEPNYDSTAEIVNLLYLLTPEDAADEGGLESSIDLYLVDEVATELVVSGPEYVEIEGVTTIQQVETGMTDYKVVYVPFGEKYIKFLWLNSVSDVAYTNVVKSFITQSISTSTNINTNTSAATTYVDYTYGAMFTFKVPSTWEAVDLSGVQGSGNDKVRFDDANGDQIAMLTCPFVVTGYEMGEIIYDLSKSYATNYTARLLIEDYSGEIDMKNIGLLILEKGALNSCQLFTSSDDWDFTELTEVYKYIYDNLE